MSTILLQVECFKAIESNPVSVKLGDLTLLFGPNASGKSSLIEALFHALAALVRLGKARKMLREALHAGNGCKTQLYSSTSAIKDG